MEKVMYVLMGAPGVIGPWVGDVLRHETVPAMRSRGVRRMQVNVVASELGPPFGVTPEADAAQLTAALSGWVDAAERSPFDGALPDPGGSGSWSGYLVSEAEPQPNTTQAPGSQGRIPGFAQIVLLSRPEGLGWSEWQHRWQGAHTSIALATQATFRYVQNVVLRPLTAGAPHYAAVVEECFPLEAASDLHVYFDAVGDDGRLARHMAAMSESCDRFMDGAAPVAWTTEYVFDDQP
ncbi:MAG: hypothetical protein ACRDYY_13375 [Acidimicrobiales bacterium]